MIVFVSICYWLAVWLIFVKFKKFEFTRTRKIWSGILFIVLIGIMVVMMKLGAPYTAARFNIQKDIIQIAPQVGGLVTEVNVEPNTPVKKGDILFQIDPTTYERDVRALEAQLAVAISSVAQLEKDLIAAESSITDVTAQLRQAESQYTRIEEEVAQSIRKAAASERSASASLLAANQTLSRNQRLSRAQVQAAREQLVQVNSQYALAEKNFERAVELLKDEAIPQVEYDARKTKYLALKAQERQLTEVLRQTQVAVADTQSTKEARVESASSGLESARAGLVAAELTSLDKIQGQEAKVASLRAKLAGAMAQRDKIKTALETTYNGENANVGMVREKLEKARYFLEATTVRAPTDGYVVAQTLEPGFIIRAQGRVMRFISTENVYGVGIFDQNVIRNIKKGAPAEVALQLYPGRLFNATVTDIVWASGENQVRPGQMIPKTSKMPVGTTYAVKLKFDEDVDPVLLQQGSFGACAIYTEEAKAFQIIIKVVIRMQSFQYYL